MRLIIIALILCGFGSSYAQQDLINTLAEQAVKIDSLEKVANNYRQLADENKTKLNKVKDTINTLKAEIFKFKNISDEKNHLEKQLKLKSDSLKLKSNSLTIFKSNLLDKDNQLITQRITNKKEVQEAREAGRNEVLTSIEDYYKSKSFDELIEASSETSVKRDSKIIGNAPDLTTLFSDLDKFLSTRKLLQLKFEATKIEDAQVQLNQIKRESESLSKLKNTIQDYNIYNEGLKNVIAKIISLDAVESVNKMPREIQSKKFNKIMIEISDYIFNYDFNFLKYPYLSEVLFEIINRKGPNPDSNISDLAQKL